MTHRHLLSADEPTGQHAAAEAHYDMWYYFGVLRRWWWLIATTAVVALAAGWWTQRDSVPMYTAETLLQQNQGTAQVVPWAASGGADFGTALDIIRSNEVMGPVTDSLGLQLRLIDQRDRRSRIISWATTDHAAPTGKYFLAYENGAVQLRVEEEGAPIASASPGESLTGPGFELMVGDPGLLVEPTEFRIANYDVTMETFRRKLRIEQGSGPDLIWIRGSLPDRQFAADIVNMVGVAFQRLRSRGARDQAARTRQIIADQLADVADSLHAVQGLVIQYAERTRLANPDAEGTALTSELLASDSRRMELQYSVRLLAGLVAGLETSNQGDEALQQILALGGDLVPQIPGLASQLQNLELQRSELMGSQFGRTAADPLVQQVDSQIETVKASARTAARQSLELMRSQLGEEQSRYGSLRAQAGALPGVSAEYGRLQQRVTVVQNVFDDLVGKYYEAQVAEGVEAGDITIVSAAAVPVLPEPSRKGLYLTVAFVAGLIVGIVGALLLDQLDSRIRRADDVERAANLQVVGTIPHIRSLSAESMSLQVGKDAFRTLRTHLRFASDSQPRVIAVTSATPRDGKSTVAANLALTLAEQGSRTVLVDTDLRRPQIHTTFGIAQAPGLTEVLTESMALDDVVNAAPELQSLDIISCGSAVPSPTELIGGKAFDEFVAELRDRYDYVVIDTPPLMAVTDGALVAALVDGTLIVVRANRTDQDALENAVNQLRRLRVPLLGVVLNGVPTGRTSGYSYYPSHYPSYASGASDGDKEKDKKRPLLRMRDTDKRAG